MTRPGQPPGTPDPWDAPLSVIRSSVDDLGVWLFIWSARTEPDARARRCASDAVDAIDAMLAGLHGIRARLVGEIRASDDEAALRVDAQLARIREGPPGRDGEGGPAVTSTPGRQPASSPPPPQQRSSVDCRVQRGGVGGGDRR